MTNSFYLQANYIFSTIVEDLGRFRTGMQASCLSYMPDEFTPSSCQRPLAPGLHSVFWWPSWCTSGFYGMFDSIPSFCWDIKQLFINSFPFHAEFQLLNKETNVIGSQEDELSQDQAITEGGRTSLHPSWEGEPLHSWGPTLVSKTKPA